MGFDFYITNCGFLPSAFSASTTESILVAWRLRNMTHEESPWKNAYKQGCSNEISIADMKAYFQTQLES